MSRLRLDLLAAVAALVLAPTAGAYVRGVDVSHYNGRIDWEQVAGAGYDFAIVQATKGNDGADARYDSNRDDAAAAGLSVGAYHFARPGGGTSAAQTRDALAEARHFAARADPAADELVPMLDLERSGGLSPAQLVSWTSTWLREAERLVGARPAVYTSVSFWRHSLGNTTAFARGGYALWLARWTGASRPDLPASGWSGAGWTFWQWTSCGRVPGMRGCVDLDRFRGDDLTPYLVGSAPDPVVEPELAGAAAVGQLLTATEGGWSGADPLTFRYAWNRCDADGEACAPIADATSASYVAAADDVGHTLVARVTAANRAGSATAVSFPSAIVAP